jgi:phosphoribosylformylglycinamidine synthase subunit PurS
VKATVVVRPKPGILDPQGEAVGSALGHLGFEVEDTRVGKVIDLEVEAADAATARAEVERMCEQLLANPLIESYEVEIVG